MSENTSVSGVDAPASPTTNPPQTPKTKKAPAPKQDVRFVVIGDNGPSIVPEQKLAEIVNGSDTKPKEIYLLGKRVRGILVFPGKQDLISGKKDKDTIKFTV